MSIVAWDENALGAVTRVRGVYADGSPEALAAMREPVEPLAMGERACVDNIPDLRVGELVEGRLTIGRRYFGIVRENRLGEDVTYRVDGYQVENNDWRMRTNDIDARRPITRVRLIVRLRQPLTCGLHQCTMAANRSYFLADADGQTPATEALLHLPLTVHVPCDDASHHAIEVVAGGDGQLTIDVTAATKPWPATPAEQAANVARVAGWDAQAR